MPSTKSPESSPVDEAVQPGGHSSQRLSRRGGTNSLSASKYSSPGHHHNNRETANSSSSSDVIEINLRDILDQIINHVTRGPNVAEWFKVKTTTTKYSEPSPSGNEIEDADLNSAETVG